MKNMKVICAVLLILAILLYPLEYKSEYCSYELPLIDFVIVLDAGHGGEDGGAIGVKTLVREKDINLSIVKKTARLFESVGATVVLTRSDENALCSGKYSKMKDMQARSLIIEKAKPYIVISVHCNSFPQNRSSIGAQMFYYPGSVTGEMLAQSIQDSIATNVDKSNSRKIKSEKFYMLRHGNSTNVMIECGFLSSPEEEILLCDEDYQGKIAYAIFDGTESYILKITSPLDE